jgi:hypothetical protein
MEAHALTARLPSLGLSPPMTFPALVLLASGGHNMLVLCEGIGRHRIIGTTLDDSAGECFDKIARLLGITAIPGGSGLDLGCMKADTDAGPGVLGQNCFYFSPPDLYLHWDLLCCPRGVLHSYRICDQQLFRAECKAGSTKTC